MDGGFLIINYLKYREYSRSSNPESERKRRYRERIRDNSGHVPNVHGHSASASASSSDLLVVKGDPTGKVDFNGRGWDGLTPADLEAWAKAYPACDVPGELSRAAEWILANPKKGVKSNYRRFLVNWLSRAQDRGGSTPSVRPADLTVQRERRVGANRYQASPEEQARMKAMVDYREKLALARMPEIEEARARHDTPAWEKINREIEQATIDHFRGKEAQP